MRLFGYPYNDLVTCKDSPDYLPGPVLLCHIALCPGGHIIYVPAGTQSYVIIFVLLKESPCRQRGLNSEPLGYNGPESATIATAPARHDEDITFPKKF